MNAVGKYTAAGEQSGLLIHIQVVSGLGKQRLNPGHFFLVFRQMSMQVDAGVFPQ